MHRERILIVEDDPFLLQLLADVLGREHEVLLAHDGAEGLRVALAAKPDAVVTDLTMPVSGLDLIRGLHANISTRGIPVVVMTTRCLDQGPQGFLAHEANVRDYFNKGDDLKTLRAKVSGLFASHPAYYAGLL